MQPITTTLSPDIITINHLEINAIIGTYTFERRLKQTLWLNLHFTVDARAIAEHDDINMRSCVDYEHINDTIIQFGIENSFFLLETFAEKLSNYLFTLYPLKWLKLEITKVAALKNAQGVKISICRNAPAPA